MTSRNDDILIQAMVSRLDRSVDELDPAIAAKLNQARLGALKARHGVQNENNLVSNIQQQLQKSEALPADVNFKLNEIRRKAVSRNTSNPASVTNKLQTLYQAIFGANYRLTAGMAATACLTLTVSALFYNAPPATNTLPLDPEIGLIASADELELYENLDFYLWLAENEVLP